MGSGDFSVDGGRVDRDWLPFTGNWGSPSCISARAHIKGDLPGGPMGTLITSLFMLWLNFISAPYLYFKFMHWVIFYLLKR